MRASSGTPCAWVAAFTMSLFLAVVAASPALAVDTTWTFDGDGSWFDPANWDNGVPVDDTFDVFIDDGDAAVNVLLQGFGSFGSLALGEDDTLTVQASMGQFPSAGLISANGFTNDGTIVLSGTFSPQFHNNIGYSTIEDGALVNGPTGLIDFALFGGPNNFQTIDGNLTNLGTVLVRGGGVAELTKFGGGGAYANHGQFTVGSSFGFGISEGSFTQADGTLDVVGPFDVHPGSTLNLTGGETNLSSELRIATDGNVNLLPGGVLNMTGSGIVYNSGTFTQDGGTLNFTSWFFGGGTYRFLGGTVNGVPVLTQDATLEIGPAATDPASFLFLGNNSLVGNVQEAQVLTVDSQFADDASLTAASGFTNNGEVWLTSTGSGATELLVTTGALTNGPSGVLHFQAGGTGGRVFRGDLVNHGAVTVDQSTTFDKTDGSYTNQGQVTVNNDLTLASGTLTNAVTGVISGVGLFTGTLDNDGTVRAASGALQVAGAATNNGVFESLNASMLNVTAALTNLSGGVLTGGTYRVVDSGGGAEMTIAGSAVNTIAADTAVELSGDGAAMTFGGTALADSLTENAGTLKILDGHHFNMTSAFLNTGTITLGDQAGDETALTTGGPLTNAGTLTGHGTIHGHVMNPSGAVAPGSSAGTLHIDGDYTQGATGRLVVELASTTDFDRLLVDEAALLDGLLSVSLLGGFAPAQDDAFVILTGASVNGTFDDPLLPALTADLAWRVLYDATSVTLVAYLPGDYNRNGMVDAADYIVWRDRLSQQVAPGDGADGDFDGAITAADYGVWKSHFGGTAIGGAGAHADAQSEAVPEPACSILCGCVLVGIAMAKLRTRCAALVSGDLISDT